MSLMDRAAERNTAGRSTGTLLALTEGKQKLCAEAVDQLLARCDDVSTVMIAFRDGRAFVSRARSTIEPGKFAAMSSSLMALGNSVLRELGAGGLDHVLIEGTNGKLVVSSVPGSDGLLIIAVQANHSARLGLVLGHTKTCALSISSAIR